MSGSCLGALCFYKHIPNKKRESMCTCMCVLIYMFSACTVHMYHTLTIAVHV